MIKRAMDKSIYLHSFEPILPKYHLPQEEIVKWTMLSHKESLKVSGSEIPTNFHKLEKFCVSKELIEQRYFECPDVDENWSEHSVYKITEKTPQGLDIFVRNKFFEKRATEVVGEIYSSGKIPDHLIHVTCTGYVSPSPAQKFFSSMVVKPEITHAYHMGCYASLPAIRMAHAFVKAGSSARADVVHTEMCSLHLNPSVSTPEQMVVQTLFADGHIKYSLSHDCRQKSFRFISVKEELVPETSDDMTWIPAAFGMSMTLSRDVPSHIGTALENFVKNICTEAGIDFGDMRRNGIFAIHPGGPKIIKHVQEKLDLTFSQIKYSHQVLKTRGNMSSATLPHVWNEILKSDIPSGTLVLSLAFGPGLTIFGSIFEVCE